MSNKSNIVFREGKKQNFDEANRRSNNHYAKHQVQSPLITKLKIQTLEKEIKLQNELIEQSEEDYSLRVTYLQNMLESVCQDIINIGNQSVSIDEDDEIICLEGDSALESSTLNQTEISPIKKSSMEFDSAILDVDINFGEGFGEGNGENTSCILKDQENQTEKYLLESNTSNLSIINDSMIDNQLKDLNRKLRDMEGQLAMNNHSSKLDISNLEKDLSDKIEGIDKKIDTIDSKEETVLYSIKRLSMDLRKPEPSSPVKITEIIHEHNYLNFKVISVILVLVAAIYFGLKLTRYDTPTF